MRAVERVPFPERRGSRHDEMCAAVAANASRIFPAFNGEVRATVEAPCGSGFVDVLAVTVGPPEEVLVAIVEVKTRGDTSSAGDIIRQLKWYEQRLPLDAPVRLVLVVENDGALPSAMLALLLHEGIDVLPIRYFTATGDSFGPMSSSASNAESAQP